MLKISLLVILIYRLDIYKLMPHNLVNHTFKKAKNAMPLKLKYAILLEIQAINGWNKVRKMLKLNFNGEKHSIEKNNFTISLVQKCLCLNGEYMVNSIEIVESKQINIQIISFASFNYDIFLENISESKITINL